LNRDRRAENSFFLTYQRASRGIHAAMANASRYKKIFKQHRSDEFRRWRFDCIFGLREDDAASDVAATEAAEV
jgi:hypothetical protein